MKDDVKLVEREDDETIDLEEIQGEIEVVRIKLVGRTMLLMNSNAGVNPLHELVKQKKILTAIRSSKRTDEDIVEVYRLDFMLGLYHDPEIGPYIPGVNIEAALLEAAKQERMGPQFKAGVRCVEDKIKLQYKGPRDIDKMWKAGTFADIRPVKLRGTSSLPKCRPCFNNWSLECSISYNGGIIDRAAVVRCLAKIGDIGICDYRKRYGKSTVEFL